jgi:ABC-type polysaccharide/polyol phosphate export permease
MSTRNQLQHILFNRHILWAFLRRDIEARYIGSAMGLFWSVINPLVLLLVYTLVFGLIIGNRYTMLGIDVGSWGFAYYICSGLLPWYAFQESLIRSTTCIVDNAHLIKQVRFPAKVLPAYITLSAIVNQIIGTVLFLALILLVFGKLPTTVFLLPFVLAIQIVLFFGLGLLFSTLHTYLRDIGPLVNIGCMLLMWGTPMLYPMELLYSERIPEIIPILVQLNPLTSLIVIHHDLLVHGTMPSLTNWAIFIGISLLSLLCGYITFTKQHGEFADLL